MDLSSHNPLDRFTGLSDLYARHRPDYPDAAIGFILSHCGLGPGSVLVDVGCGTGIAARIFAGRGLTVIGIEPNSEMRARAAATPCPPPFQPPEYREGSAEQTGLPDSFADVVLAAQAFHWFRPDEALREFHRILRPGSWAVLMWNERDERDPFTAAYGTIMRHSPEAAKLEMSRGTAGDPLLHHPLFVDRQKVTFGHGQELDEEGLVGRSFSASYAPREPDRAEAFEKALRQLFTRWQSDGKVEVRYETSVYVGRRPVS